MPYHVALDRANEVRLGRSRGGDHRTRDRADLRRSRVAARPADGGPPGPGRPARADRAGAAGQEPAPRARWAPTPFDGRGARRARRLGWGERLRDHLDDTTWLVQAALARGEHVLLEGAQGTLLDLDHGSYPFVTSSNPVAGGACTGGGIGPLQVDEVIGVMKAYSTRVGSGPYPTELTDEIGAGIAARGHEFGTVTGRPRRVGWFDAVPLRYAVAVNSVSASCSTSWTSCPGSIPFRLCVAYEIDGQRVETWPSSGVGAGAGHPDLRGLPRLGRADPRCPLAGRPAGAPVAT